MPDPRRWRPTKPRPSGEGRVLFRANEGQLIVQKWPKKRGQNRPEINSLWSEYFGRVNRAFAFLHPIEHAGWMRTTFQGRLYPRDLYTASSFGRGFGFIRPDGSIIMPRRSVYDLSNTLDLFGETPGGLLVRKGNEWGLLEPGFPGDVLTCGEEPGEVGWAPGGGGGGAGQLFTLDPLQLPSIYDGDLYLTTMESEVGGYLMSWDKGPATLSWKRHFYGGLWTGDPAVVAVQLQMWGRQEPLFQFCVRNPSTNERKGISFRAGANIQPDTCSFSSNSNTSVGATWEQAPYANHGVIFLMMRKIGTELKMYIGQTPDLLIPYWTQELGSAADAFTEVGFHFICRNDRLGPGSIVRLCHAVIPTA